MALAGLETATIDDPSACAAAAGLRFTGTFIMLGDAWRRFAASRHRAILRRVFYTVGNKMGIDNIALYAEEAASAAAPRRFTERGRGRGAVAAVEDPKLPAEVVRGRDDLGLDRPGSADRDAAALAHAVGGIAMGGVWHKPHLVKGRDSAPRVAQLDPVNVQKVVDGMYGVVNEGGTGVRAQLKGIEVCGKTGSAQVASNDFVKATARSPSRTTVGLSASRSEITRRLWWWRCSRAGARDVGRPDRQRRHQGLLRQESPPRYPQFARRSAQGQTD